LTYLCGLVAAVAFFTATAATAHSGHPQVEVSIDHLAAGGGLTVRGIDFDYESTVRLSLLRGDRPIPLGTVTADERGGFLHTFVVSAGLRAGSYRLLAASSHHSVVGATLAITTASPAAPSDDSRRGQDEPLLGSMSTVAQPSIAPLAELRPEAHGTSWAWFAAIGVGSCLLSAAALLAVRRRPFSAPS
jgi:hypothetical protein